jgi:hypothetical protein
MFQFAETEGFKFAFQSFTIAYLLAIGDPNGIQTRVEP